nr:hypothetical protein [Candidatus Sigynarchaeum springense]
MAKVGGILALVGGILLAIGGVIALGLMGTLEAMLLMYSMTWADIGLDPNMIYVNFIMTLLFGVLGIIGGAVGMKKKGGGVLALIIGIVAMVGMFIPIASATIGISAVTIKLNSSLFFVDPVLILVGGIVTLAKPPE